MKKDEVQNKWKLLSYKDMKEVKKVIVQQHYAVQFIAMAGKYLIPQRDDDSHTNIKWLSDKHIFLSNRIQGKEPFYIGVSAKDLNLLVLRDRDTIIEEFSLEGKRIVDGFRWLKNQIVYRGVDKYLLKRELHYTIPKHELAEDGVFESFDRGAALEVSKYRSNADIVLKYLGCNCNISAAPRIWPHHFDSASIVPLTYSENKELVRSIGIGFAIPDGDIDEPYFYVTLWDKNNDAPVEGLPKLAIGNWFTNGWFGAVLKMGELLQVKPVSVQASSAVNFFETAIDYLRKA